MEKVIGDARYHEGQIRATIEKLDRSIQERVVVHVCQESREFAQKLAAYGMTRYGLPMAIGGSWGYQDFVLWQELRLFSEWHLPIGRGVRKIASRYSIPTSTEAASLEEEGQQGNERKRRMNVIYSRRKRERKRIKVEGMREKCGTLRQEQKELLQEGRRLEKLLKKAEAIVSNTISKQKQETS